MQHLINNGIARLEEVRDADGTLINLYVRVRRVAEPVVGVNHEINIPGRSRTRAI